eukprot:CAMPEP_0182453084 /NCGR_PEP_ID=MMETSP1319-20130603/296_1 /TAXON_ID=172717 /ORGANISM="Bolidomonas pacifica, Strain RCC208" /LENGTH=516 /DNA_ID=CAMNT_0024650975 /DNA_START=252 /DNA_END=1798 /DNA_ORIENTATION=+
MSDEKEMVIIDSTQPPPPPLSPPSPLLRFPLHSLISSRQQNHGLKFSDHGSYGSYCSRRIRRLRSSLLLTNRPAGGGRRSKKYEGRPVTADVMRGEGGRVDHLDLVAMEAERAWANAMSCKASSGGRGGGGGGEEDKGGRRRRVSRLGKAAKHAARLEGLCGFGADERTRVEAAAYAAWMRGARGLEVEEWEKAAKDFGVAQALLKGLAETAGAEERRALEERAEGCVPSIRYCKYNMGGGSEAVGLDDRADLLRLLDGPGAAGLREKLEGLLDEGRKREARDGDGKTDVVFRGREVAVADAGVRVKLLKAGDLQKELTAALGGDDEELVEKCYVKALTAYDDALDFVGRAQAKDGSKASKSAGTDFPSLSRYLKYMKLRCMMGRGESMVRALAGSHGSPHELVHVYESLLQNAKQVQDLGGGEPGDEFGREAEAQVLRLRTLRCRQLGLVYESMGEYGKAVAVLGLAQDLATETGERYEALGGDEEVLVEMAELEGAVTGDKSRAQARAYLKETG